jgi:hypothetical protein
MRCRRSQRGYTCAAVRELKQQLKSARTRSHNAATNCYRLTYTLAGNLFCQLQATRVNFFAATRSALVILRGKNTKCRGGRIPRCAIAARLDGSMTLKHVCAVIGMRHRSYPTGGVLRVRPAQCQALRRPFYDFRPVLRLLGCAGSTICLDLPTSVALLKFQRPSGSRGKRRVNLGHETALAC